MIHWHENIKERNIVGYDFYFNYKYETSALIEKIHAIGLPTAMGYSKNENFIIERNTAYLEGPTIEDSRFKKKIHILRESAKSRQYTLLKLTIKPGLGEEKLTQIVDQKNFEIGMMYSKEIAAWVSMSFPQAYRYRGGLKIFKHPTFQSMMVDLSDRVSRAQSFGNYFIKGASSYWLNKEKYQIDVLKTERTKKLFTVKDFTDKTARISLYENIADGLEPTNLAKIQTFISIMKNNTST